jgi:hypothetical protein
MSERRRHTGRPDYCPDDLREDEICPACGASVENLLACNARFNGRRGRPLLEFVLVDKQTGEVIAKQTVLRRRA